MKPKTGIHVYTSVASAGLGLTIAAIHLAFGPVVALGCAGTALVVVGLLGAYVAYRAEYR